MWARSPFSNLLAAGLKEETHRNVHVSHFWQLSAPEELDPPQTPDIHGSWKSLSPPAARPQRASACAPAWNVFATVSPGLGSSELCGSGDTAQPAPPLCAPPPGDAAPPLPGLRVLRWSERGPAPSCCSLQPTTQEENIQINYKQIHHYLRCQNLYEISINLLNKYNKNQSIVVINNTWSC